jgi:hypothetical protein
MKTISMERLRSCSARTINEWDKADVKDRLYGKGDTREGQFCLLESLDFPTNETHFDVAHDEQHLYVSVMTHTSGDMGRLLQGFEGDSNVVEVLFDPFHDHLGLLQFGCGDLGDTYENTHWPYRDATRNEFLDLPWSVEVEDTKEKPDSIQFFFFQFDLRAFQGNRCVGFNVARSQAAIRENSSWNRVSGIGFPDPDCLGHLWLKPPGAFCESAWLRLDGDNLTAIEVEWTGESTDTCSVSLINPCGEEITTLIADCKGHACLEPGTNVSLDKSGRYRLVLKMTEGHDNADVEPDEFFLDHQASDDVRSFQLQGTYDWPDHVLNVPYSPDDLRREMAWYKDVGLERVYWLDYNHYDSEKAKTKQSEVAGKNLQRTNELFGGTDHLVVAAGAARKAGLEFITIFKPFEQPMAFIEADLLHDQRYFMRRNPDWSGRTDLPIKSIRLFQRDESPFPFSPSDVRVWYASDAGEWTAVRGDLDITEKVVDREEGDNSPAGIIPGEVTRRVRALEINGLSLVADRVGIECLHCDPTLSLRNRQYMFAEIETSHGATVIGVLRIHQGSPTSSSEDDGSWWQNAGGPGHEASWARMDTNADQLSTIKAKQIALEFDLKPPSHMDGILEPAFPEVRSYWLDYLRRGLDAGADGVGLRIAHHTRCYDWLDYMFADPVLAEFRNQFGRDPEPIVDDFTRIRGIRGDFYTQFLREAKAMVDGAGKKLILHVENRMIVPAEADCYTQIFWDWRTWIQEGLADEIDLKYLGPNQQAAYREVVPLARKHGIKVNWISAHPEPRGHPRSIHEAPRIAQQAAAAGLDGINLYELWLYRRMTPSGYPMTRGSGEAIIRKIRDRLDDL